MHYSCRWGRLENLYLRVRRATSSRGEGGDGEVGRRCSKLNFSGKQSSRVGGRIGGEELLK